MTLRILAVLTGLTLLLAAARAQEIDWKTFDPKKATPEEMERVNAYLEGRLRSAFAKTTGDPREIRSLIIRGNKITTVVYNYGTITRPNTLSNVADLVWNNLGYGFEFTPLVGGEVLDTQGDTVHILDDGMWLSTQGGYAPDGSIKWGWLPKAGYAASGQSDIAAWSARSDVGGDLTRRPHSWPESWYNSTLGRYVWPAFLGDDATSPDEEVYFACDDWTNAKYQYYPFPDDSTKRGLGLDLECRFFQFNNPLAEDIIFLVYRVTNRSPKEISKVYFGMYGDPHVGGSNDYSDDLAFFIPPAGPLADPYSQRARSMVYAWDDDGVGASNLPTGYFGFKFLESPTNSGNGRDDDDDGIIDESPFNDAGTYIDGATLPLTTGISDTAKYVTLYGKLKPRWSGDEDGDWNQEKDDVGLDGLKGTGDFGEGNGKPDAGYDANGTFTSEPHFGIRDVDESDQIGLTSFYALPYTQSIPNVPKNDILFWQLLSSDSIAIDQALFNTPGDNIFVYGSGPFALSSLATQRFSIALLMGENLDDLILNAETAQRVLEANYLFAQPPPKVNLTAVPGNGRVTLFWDNTPESTTDPLTGTRDFEGYKIYRSEDYTFSDIYTITDANGVKFLPRPLTGKDGKLAQFDLVNTWSGLHPVEYLGRGVKFNLGSNTGLVHEYVDSTVTNGKTYYYAVASYDHGFDSLGIQLPPTESQISITRDPITFTLSFDQNTASATPGPLPAGQVQAVAGKNALAERIAGISTGAVSVKVLDDLKVRDDATYNVDFRTQSGSVVYDVSTVFALTDTISGRDTLFVPLAKKNLIASSLVVRDASGSTVDPARYSVDTTGGRIRGSQPGTLQSGQTFAVQYRYHPVFGSGSLTGQDDNAAFDGLRIYAHDATLGLDTTGGPTSSGWRVKAATNLVGAVQRSTALPVAPFRPAPIDFQIVWNRTDTTARGKWLYPGDTLLNNSARKLVVCPFRIINVTDTTHPRILVNAAGSDSIWRPGREIVIITPPKYSPSQSPLPVHAAVIFSAPAGQPLILPTQGDIFDVNTTKPFASGDRYTFTTTASKFDPAGNVSSILDRISVVPNPYVAYSNLETTGADATKRGEYRLQFRNLPPKCTIRIYTMVGELVDTIEKDDNTSMATWNLLSNEGQRIAYGVYLYHVDAPGVGEKIGRFAVIK